MFFGKWVGYTDIPSVDTSNDRRVSCVTKKHVVAAFITASLPVFASPDLSGRSNLGGNDEWTGITWAGTRPAPTGDKSEALNPEC